MNILFYRHSLLSRGGDKMIVLQANHLATLGHDVCLMTAVLDTVFTLDPRISIRMLPSRSKTCTILKAATSRFDVDLIVADIVAMVTFLSIRNRGKVICYAQDYDESYYTLRFHKMLVRVLYFISLRLFRIPTIAVSNPLGDLLFRHFKADVRVVENGIDTSKFFPDPDHGLISMKSGRKSVLILSRTDRRKGFDLAREVISRIAETHSGSIEIWTVGEPNDGFFPGVCHRHLGYVDESRLRSIMSSADIFLYPSRHEGYPLMVLESFACRVPVVTTDAVPYAEHGVNSLVSRIEDVETLSRHLRMLLDDDFLAERLAEAGYIFAREHSLDSACRLFAESVLTAHDH